MFFVQVIIIWTITVVATFSVLTGVKYGIRRISEFCFCCGCGLMAVVFLMDETIYLLNLWVQSMGYYLSSIVQLGSHTDAFEQLGAAAGESLLVSSNPKLERGNTVLLLLLLLGRSA